MAHPPEDPSIDPRIANARPGWALLILAAPVAGFVLVALLYAGMLSLGFSGRGGDGGPVTYRVQACDEAVDLIEGRLVDMGLPVERTDDGGVHRLHSQRIGRPDIDVTVPDTLAMPGAFELRHGDEVLARNPDIAEASTRLDGMMDPWLLLRLKADAAEAVVKAVNSEPTGRLTFVVDGTPVAMQPNRRDVMRGEVEAIPLDDMTAAERMQRIAAWSVVIDHGPLPCPATVEVEEGM